jgi:hypothetical protein
VQFDTTLNIVWFLLGLFAVASGVRTASRRAGGSRRWPRCLHALAIALVVAALFPYISASDDVVRVERFSSTHHHDQLPDHKKKGDNLIRLYEVMDAPLVCEVQRIVLTLAFIALVALPVVAHVERAAPLIAGRSPPSLLNA